ncbi:MAG: tyrosine-type recombinase/integrase [Bacteroidota bacterium]
MKEEFLLHLQFEKNFSDHTIIAYRIDIEQMFSYVKNNYSILKVEEISSEIIRSWVIDMLDKKVNPKSVNRKISALKTYFKYLIKKGVIQTNPLQKVFSPKTSKRLPFFIEKSNMETLFSKITFGSEFEKLRDTLILELFYGTGIRLSELIKLKTLDFDYQQSTIKVLGKRKKERIIPLSFHLNILCKEYLNEKEKLFPKNELSKLFFVTYKGNNVYPKMIYRIVYKYIELITTIDKKSPHVLRHTFATHMLDNGADINAIKEILGHTSLAATQIYTHNTIIKLKNTYKQAHPRA